MKRKLIIVNFTIILFCVLLLFSACSDMAAKKATGETVIEPSPSAQETIDSTPEPQPTETLPAVCMPSASTDPKLAADSRFYPWIVYWDHETAISESSNIASVMGSISVFAAYFKDDDSIIFPKTSEDTLQAVRDAYGATVNTYLTFVNDIKYDNGKSSLKDADLLRRLFSSQTRMSAHIDEIVALAKAKGFNGIEIDYENIKGDDALWQLYAEFLTALRDRVNSEGLKLRIVLETSALTKASFPAGPEYTVMVYNLYGNHSNEPGPKADEDFILETAAKSVCLGPDVCFAFATGGFDWSSTGEITSLNEAAAAELAQVTQSTPARDQKSGALSFTYQNETAHTVWYADGETLCFWMKAAEEAGINHFALWRLGGNSEDSLRSISAYLENLN